MTEMKDRVTYQNVDMEVLPLEDGVAAVMNAESTGIDNLVGMRVASFEHLDGKKHKLLTWGGETAILVTEATSE